MTLSLSKTAILLLTLCTTSIAVRLPAQEIPTPAGMHRGLIKDPVFNNMDAFQVFYPNGWHFDGKLLQGTKCMPVPFPVFRAASRDGLAVMERMPRVDLVYGNNPDIDRAQSDCLKIPGPMSAQDYLKHLAQSMNVEYVSDSPVPQEQIDMNNKSMADAQQSVAGQYKTMGSVPPKSTTELARAIIRYKNGNFTIKGMFKGNMVCDTIQSRNNPRTPAYSTTKCHVDVRYEHAPEDRFQATLNLLDPKKTGAAPYPAWVQAWTDDLHRRTAANIQQIQRQGAQNIANIQAQGQQFRESQAVRQRQHEEFDCTLRRGTQASMNRTAQAGAARHTAASDVVDYALDQQTVRDPDTGQITKATSAYSYTWVDSTGKVGYQTNDPNANPNGSLQGNWSRQTVTHGDGSPR